MPGGPGTVGAVNPYDLASAAADDDRPSPAELDPSALSDDDLTQMIAVLTEEQASRALERCDPEALTEAGFVDGFDAKGAARMPWLAGGILVCPGSVVERSATSHDCTFVTANDHWVFEHPDRIHDEVRKVPHRGRENQRSITLLAAPEGLTFDVVSSRMRTGAHHMREARRFRVTNGELELVTTRAPKPRAASH